MSDVNVETIKAIQELSRPDQLEVIEYGKYTKRDRLATYDDGEAKYTVYKTGSNDRTVHSRKSFVECVKEELSRRNKEKGELSTLSVGIDGGYFIADDDFNEGKVIYKRVLSQQWETLAQMNGRIMDHEEFLMALLKLSPSIKDFHKTYKGFLTVRIVGKSEMTSNPVFVNNQAESGYLVKYKLEGQNADTIIPDSLKVVLPYIKASEKKYEIDVDVQILNSSNNQLRIKVNIPLMENIEEQAIIDEITDIKEQLKEFDKMLVLSDI